MQPDTIVARRSILTNEPADEAKRLRQFIDWILIFGGLACLIEFALGFALRSVGILGLGVVSAIVMLVLLLGRYFVGRGYTQPVAVGLGIILLLLCIAVSVILPDIVVTITLGPVIIMALVLPYVSSRMLSALAGIMILGSTIIVALALLVNVSAPFSPLARNVIVIVTVPMMVGMIALLLVQFRTQLSNSLSAAREANMALRQAQVSLEAQVVERTAALREALAEVESRAAEQARLFDELNRERDVIRELSVPILPVSPTTLVMPLVGALDSARLLQMHERALTALEQNQARRLLLDLTGVPIVDTQVARGLIELAGAVRLLGASLILIGIRSEVAQTIVSLGVDLSSIHTHRDLSSALSDG